MATSIIEKSLASDVASLNDSLAKHTIYTSADVENVSLPAATFVEACSISLPAGKWIVFAHVSFNSVASATRRIAYIQPGGIAENGIDMETSGNLTAFTAYMSNTTATTTYKLLCRSETAVTLGRARMFAIGIKS